MTMGDVGFTLVILAMLVITAKVSMWIGAQKGVFRGRVEAKKLAWEAVHELRLEFEHTYDQLTDREIAEGYNSHERRAFQTALRKAGLAVLGIYREVS